MPVTRLVGIDVSSRSIEVAQAQHGRAETTFQVVDEFSPRADIDLVITNGVFHHIPPDQRPAALQLILATLRPGGVFAFWENNPWNPGTRYVMSRIPFDRDAITISVPEARKLLSGHGFAIERIDTLFYFPRLLAPLADLRTLVVKAAARGAIPSPLP